MQGLLFSPKLGLGGVVFFFFLREIEIFTLCFPLVALSNNGDILKGVFAFSLGTRDYSVLRRSIGILQLWTGLPGEGGQPA